MLDLIGAARPSIADPFLPGEDPYRPARRRSASASAATSASPATSPCHRSGARRTRPWARSSAAAGIRSGSGRAGRTRGSWSSAPGPAGLEAARALGVRGYEVVLAEAGRDLGGRVAREARLPGLAAWVRVLDYRQQAIETMGNVEVYRESRDERRRDRRVRVRARGRGHRRGLAARRRRPLAHRAHPGTGRGRGTDSRRPDGRAAPVGPPGRAVRRRPLLPRRRARRTAARRGLRGRDRDARTAGVGLDRGDDGGRQDPAAPAAGRDHAADERHAHRGRRRQGDRGRHLHGTGRGPRGGQRGHGHRPAAQGRALPGAAARRESGEIRSVRAIGDAWAPGTIAAAVWSGRRYAEEFGADLPGNDVVPFRREVTRLAGDTP